MTQSAPHTPPPNTFPTETEIYILPTGDVIVADLPAELEAMTRELGEDSTDAPDSTPDPAALQE